MMTKITTLFLDIVGVLLTNGWEREARRRAEVFHLDCEGLPAVDFRGMCCKSYSDD